MNILELIHKNPLQQDEATFLIEQYIKATKGVSISIRQPQPADHPLTLRRELSYICRAVPVVVGFFLNEQIKKK